jgi:hypothetical protein
VFRSRRDGRARGDAQMGTSGPRVLLTDHLEDQRTILTYRVEDLVRTEKQLRSKGWKRACYFFAAAAFSIASTAAASMGLISWK